MSIIEMGVCPRLTEILLYVDLKATRSRDMYSNKSGDGATRKFLSTSNALSENNMQSWQARWQRQSNSGCTVTTVHHHEVVKGHMTRDEEMISMEAHMHTTEYKDELP